MPEVETHTYDESDEPTGLEAETIITVGETEFIVLQRKNVQTPSVYQREKGSEHPFKQLAPEERSLKFPADDEWDPRDHPPDPEDT